MRNSVETVWEPTMASDPDTAAAAGEPERTSAGSRRPHAEGLPIHGWVAAFLAATALLGTYYAVPRAGVAQTVVLCVVNGTAALAALIAAVRSRGLTRLVWTCLGTGMTFSTLANRADYGHPLATSRAVHFPSLVDVLRLTAYLCIVLAVLALAQHRREDDHRSNVVDAVIIALGGGTAIWVYMLGPAVHATGLQPHARLVSSLYPTMDLIIFVLLVRFVVGSRRDPCIRLLIGAVVAVLVSDLVKAIELSNGSYHLGGAPGGLSLLSYLLITIGAIHPMARSLPQVIRPARHRITVNRLVLIGAAVLVGPILLIVYPRGSVLVATTSVTNLLLVLARMGWLNWQLASANMAVEDKTDELRHQALHDALTGLPNRALITDRIEQLLARSSRNGTIGAALYVDLDGFKNVNDTLGHDAGDQLLRAVATRLTASLREADTIGRMGGDEFVILIDGGQQQCAPELVAERIIEVMRQPFDLQGIGLPIVVTTSVGIALGLREAPGELLREADVALYQAKAAGKNCYAMFHPEMETAVQRRHELDFDLRSALAGDQFRLVYQPIYNLDDLTLVGVEALLRWDHPKLGLIEPNEFIPLLESSGQIIDVGRWVLREACTVMASWRSGGSELIVSVNVSGRQLDRDVIVDHVREALEISQLDASALTIEITETALMQAIDTTARRLRELKELGVQVAIDDFGTGYSSLSYLQRFPVDCLKIDRAFTDAITRSPESDALIHTLVQLGKDLGLKTLAEGVERAGQLDHLRGENVNQVQGFLLSRPLDPVTLEAELLDSANVIKGRTRNGSASRVGRV
jgi:diguanylate cyclase (GGDEF)-like protein